MRGARILVVEDEDNTRKAIRSLLEEVGYSVSEAASGEEAIVACVRDKPDLVLLDVVLPAMSGFECAQIIRAASPVPIIMVTGRDSKADVVAGLEVGADDYVAKPFFPRELLARIGAVLRRVSEREPPERESVAVGRVRVSLREGRASISGVEVSLTKTELKLLHCLALHANEVLSRQDLLSLVWGYEDAGDPRLVDVHVRRLRQKVELDPERPLIETVRGFGYRLSP